MPTAWIGTMRVDLDTVQQVVELARLLEQGPPSQLPLVTAEGAKLLARDVSPAPAAMPHRKESGGGRKMWDREVAWKFLSSLTGNARPFMNQLIMARRITSADLAKAMNVPPNLLGPATRSIKSKAKALGMKIPFEIKLGSPGHAKVYVLSGEFYGAASQGSLGTEQG